MKSITYLAVAIAFFTVGCGGEQKLKARAAFDLSCSEDQIQIVDLGGTARGATGCGQKASYVCRNPGATMANCSEWVLNSDGKAAE